MVYGYIRVSTEEQNLENQKKAILERFNVESWVEEKRSGMIDYKKRNLGGLMEQLQQGDALIVTELSRLGRSLSMIFNIISILKEKKVRVVAIKNNFDMSSDGQNDIVSSVLLFAFGLSAQIERELISERTKQGLAVAKAKGKRIGRQYGEKPTHFKLTPHKDKIRKYIAQGRTVNSMADEFGVSWLTMKNFVTVNINVKPLPPLKKKPKRHGHPTYREIEYFKTHSA
jgi:DNA invertase Pin-like site-specific DNA recombinase